MKLFGVTAHILALVLACLAWLAPRTATAREDHASLNWVRAAGADGCVSPGALASQVESWLGPVFVPPAQADLAVEGFVLRSADAFEARITISRRDGAQLGERRLRVSGESCEPLALQAAFVIAVTLDPEMTLAALPPELEALLADSEEDPGELLRAELEKQATPQASVDPFAAPVPAVEEAKAAPSERAAQPVPTQTRGRIRRARLSVGVSLGALPHAAASLLASQLWARRFLGFDLSVGGILPSQSSHHFRASDTRRSFWAGSLRLRTGLCHRPIGERVWLFSCLSASASYYFAPSLAISPGQRDPLSAFNWGGYLVGGIRVLEHLSAGLELELESNMRGVYFRAAPDGEHALDTGSESPVRFAALFTASLDF